MGKFYCHLINTVNGSQKHTKIKKLSVKGEFKNWKRNAKWLEITKLRQSSMHINMNNTKDRNDRIGN